MPSGKVHDQITVVAALVCAPLYYTLVPLPPRDALGAVLLVGGTLFSGLMLSPDLDLDSSIYRRWGPLRFLWWPYQKAVPHRSPLSHSFLLGPLLRLAYLLLLSWGLLRIVTWLLVHVVPFDRGATTRHSFDAAWYYFQAQPHHAHTLLAGLFLGPALHVAADLLVSGAKKRGRRR